MVREALESMVKVTPELIVTESNVSSEEIDVLDEYTVVDPVYRFATSVAVSASSYK